MSSTLLLPVVIGVDIGGTNTDAVVLHTLGGIPRVLSEVKEQTTIDVVDGVKRAVVRCLIQAKESGYLVAPIQVHIGTTHFVNAVVQHKHLAKVAVIRLCGPISEELPPFSDFPIKLTDIVRGSVHLVHGGFSIEGNERDKLDEEEIRRVVSGIKDRGVSNISIIGIFSSVNPCQELRAREIALDVYPEATVSLSHEIGDVGLLERENATILNECLKPLCKETLGRFKEAFQDIGVTCPFHFTQNDGTIISSTGVLEFPVLTFASGPTNSMRGAAFLTSQTDAVVVDIGGTTSDVGVLKKGFPRESSTHVRVAGVKTNFRMPDVLSVGLGGGSYVVENRDEGGNLDGVRVGPLSAGLNLKREALVFSDGSNTTVTATDIAVCSGMFDLGSKEKVSHLDMEMVERAKDTIHEMLENIVDRMKLGKEEIPVIVVGGGSILVDTKRKFKGASQLIIPKHFGVANAIGAALSKISVTANSVVDLLSRIDVQQMDRAVNDATRNIDSTNRKESEFATENARKPFLERARNEAIENCCEQVKSQLIKQGAISGSLEILEKSDSFVSYIKGRGLNVKVKVVGDMNQYDLAEEAMTSWIEPKQLQEILGKSHFENAKQSTTSTGFKLSTEMQDGDADHTLHPKDPFIDPTTGEWILSNWDIECIAIGSGIYGCGGGGSHYMAKLAALKALGEGKKIRVVNAERLLKNANPDKDLVFVPALIGSPTVIYEQGLAMSEAEESIRSLGDLYRIGQFTNSDLLNSDGVTIDTNDDGCRFTQNYSPNPVDKRDADTDTNVVGLMTLEFAGTNAIGPLVVAANMNLPIVDADGMTRAFPKFEMYVPCIYGAPAYPVSIIGSGNSSEKSVLLQSPNAPATEDYLRGVCLKNGCLASTTCSLSKSDVLTKAVPNVLSDGWRLGNAVLRARLEKESVTDAIVQQENGDHVITGKVVDIRSETSGGFNKGHVFIEGIDDFSSQTLVIEFQNEYLVVFSSVEGERGPARGCVPDLITVVDSVTGEPVHAEEIRYGMRVAVILIPSCQSLRDPKALEWVGPQAFHYGDDVTFVPYKERMPSRPIPPPL